MSLEAAFATFIEESRDMLRDLESCMLELEAQPDDNELLNRAFRDIHAIKGAAGLFGLDAIVAFTHVAESVLDRLRDGELALDASLAAVLLRAGDHVNMLLDAAEHHKLEDTDTSTEEALLAELQRYLQEDAATCDLETARPPVAESAEEAITDTWHISLRFGPDVFRCGMDPLSFIHYLGKLGEITHITPMADAMPAPADMDPETCYLGFEIRLRAEVEKADIYNVFEFVQDDCEINILPPSSKLGDYVDLIESLPEGNTRLGEILVGSGAITQQELERSLALQTQAHAAVPALGELLISQSTVQKELVEAALEKQKKGQGAAKSVGGSQYLRVRADKLDELINLVGELVIAGASAQMIAKRSGDTAGEEAASTISALVEDIRDASLQLRMVPIGETFQRFQRVVRDTAQELGKNIELRITGADTELDKTVVEKLSDPLMHLVRNSLDHGIESADKRAKAGKSAVGHVSLNAFHESGSIVIEVADDGSGLDLERIHEKALAKHLVKPDQELTDQEIQQLIFEPGFSTAEAVTNISGRGVGMDVVRKNIEALRGSIEVDSIAGHGCTFRIRLPLTLAIIDGFLVQVGDSSFVVPLDAVVECVELSARQQMDVRSREFIDLRGEVLPIVQLRDIFNIDSATGRRQNVVVVRYAGLKAGLVVDQLLGEYQTVIKSLGRLFAHLQGISGSTILGTGDVALILDVASLVGRVSTFEEKRLSPRSVNQQSRSEACFPE